MRWASRRRRDRDHRLGEPALLRRLLARVTGDDGAGICEQTGYQPLRPDDLPSTGDRQGRQQCVEQLVNGQDGLAWLNLDARAPYVDAASGRTYYHNAEAQQTVWEKPAHKRQRKGSAGRDGPSASRQNPLLGTNWAIALVDHATGDERVIAVEHSRDSGMSASLSIARLPRKHAQGDDPLGSG